MTMISQNKDNAAAVALLREFNQRTIAYQPIYRKITGSTTSAILLSQLMFWWAKVKQREFYKTDAELMEETALTLDEFKYAKARLKKMPFMQIDRKGVPARTFYVINENLLIAEITRLSLCNTHRTDSGNPTNCDVDIPPTITIDDTKEDTKENIDIVVLANDDISDAKPKLKKPSRNEKHKDAIEAIIKHLNDKLGGGTFKAKTKKTVTYLSALFEDSFTEQDIKDVIDFKVSEWSRSDMSKYLRPQTLFLEGNFEGYYNAMRLSALNALPGKEAAHYAFALFVSENFPKLWTSKVRCFNAEEYEDYLKDKTLKGMSLQTSDKKRDSLLKVLELLNDKQDARAKYNSLFEAYVALAKDYIK
jgi:uncharacterized phage protein (TIGR02220 family)